MSADLENKQRNNQPEKWYLKTIPIIISILLAGPLALPLVWRNNRYSRNTKIIITAVVTILTIWIVIASIKSLSLINSYYKQMEGQLPLN